MLYRVGKYVLDLRKFEVRKDERVLPAEPQVLSLLFLLVENRDRLVSKDEIVAAVWRGRAISESAISSRIKSARQLLGDDGEAQRLIRTIHGKGFRFVGEASPHMDMEGTANAERRGTKPSVAVLPFDCDDCELSVLSEGVPHDLIVGVPPALPDGHRQRIIIPLPPLVGRPWTYQGYAGGDLLCHRNGAPRWRQGSSCCRAGRR